MRFSKMYTIQAHCLPYTIQIDYKEVQIEFRMALNEKETK